MVNATTNDHILQHALYYAQLGWRITVLYGIDDSGHCTCHKGAECESPGKHPRLKGWQHQAIIAHSEIQGLWQKWPGSNLGIVLGPASGVVDVEFDDARGQATADSLLAGINTPTFRSYCSVHRLFAFPTQFSPPSAVCKAEGLECRMGTDQRGAQSVLPPSRHATGCRYEWLPNLAPWEIGLAPFPDPLVSLLQSRGESNSHSMTFVMDTDELATHPGCAEGARNATLCRLVGSHIRRRGADENLVPDALAWGGRCQPPLPSSEVLNVVRAIVQRDHQQPSSQAVATQSVPRAPVGRLITRRGDGIQPEEVQWLWPGRIPLGKLTLLCGLGEAGKTWIAMDITSRLSRGIAFPGEPTAMSGETLIATAEDGIADTIRPRLDAHGADASRWHVLELVKEGEKVSSLTLQDHAAVLDQWLAENPNVRLLILDPLSSYLGDVNSHNDAEVRTVLMPLKEIAERRRVSVIGICHLTKAQAKVVQRVSGSIAFVNAARAAWLVAKDPDDPTEERRLMLRLKGNLKGTTKTGLAFAIRNDRVCWEDGPVFVAADDIEADEAGASKQTEAESLLLEQLANGPQPAVDMQMAAASSGISKRTLRRAKQALGVEAYRPTNPGPWYWRLNV